jgi:Concanavalin A-like lectin/glucanases superfamily
VRGNIWTQKPPYGTPLDPLSPFYSRLVQVYPFNEGTIPAVEAVTGNRASLLTTAPTIARNVEGNVLTFAQFNVALSAPTYASLTTWSLIFRANITTSEAEASVFTNTGGTNGFYVDSLKLCMLDPTSFFNRSTGTFTTGVWTTGAATYDGATLRFYFNGIQDSTISTSPLNWPNTINRIGYDNNNNGLTGALAWMYLLEGACSPGEILSLTYAPFQIFQPPQFFSVPSAPPAGLLYAPWLLGQLQRRSSIPFE